MNFFAFILKRKQGLKKIENVWADMLVASSVMLCSFVYVVSSAVYLVNMIKGLIHLAEHQTGDTFIKGLSEVPSGTSVYSIHPNKHGAVSIKFKEFFQNHTKLR